MRTRKMSVHQVRYTWTTHSEWTCSFIKPPQLLYWVYFLLVLLILMSNMACRQYQIKTMVQAASDPILMLTSVRNTHQTSFTFAFPAIIMSGSPQKSVLKCYYHIFIHINYETCSVEKIQISVSRQAVNIFIMNLGRSLIMTERSRLSLLRPGSTSRLSG